jgi:formate hydrogenlyase subunit 4
MIVINILILLFFPFIFAGIIGRVKSIMGGRVGPKILQPLYDFIKLLKKGIVVGDVTSFIFQIAPSIGISCIIIAGLMLPLANHESIINFSYDFIVFAYILALAKFSSILSSMDTGSSFEGMGASREAFFSSLLEPGFFISFGSLSLLSGQYSFEKIFSVFQKPGWLICLVLILSVINFFIMLLIEGCRVPVDDPNTHLELTMIHEVMVLDNSGVDLAFIQHANNMKMFLFASIIANLLLPSGINIYIAIILFLLIIIAVAICVGLIESIIARLKLIYLPKFIFLTTSISLIILSSIVLFKYGVIK